jgi:hypothetical protein
MLLDQKAVCILVRVGCKQPTPHNIAGTKLAKSCRPQQVTTGKAALLISYVGFLNGEKISAT